MTALKDLLIRQISATGPMSIADYMAQCLLHPEHGYYATQDPFGVSGDFTTSPEISQMFGEMLGLCLAQCWIDQGSPAEFALVEIGPGRGTLMKDILRATKAVPDFKPQVHLVEASAHLRAIQRDTLGDVIWHNDVSSLPDLPTYLIANEFFDALPIRQYRRMGPGWLERVVAVTDGQLSFGLRPATPDLSHRLRTTNDNDVVEVCPALPAIVESISDKITALGGVAIFIDYGDWRSLGATFQALKNHAFASPFETPGEADLTAHVDFEAITRASNCATTKMTAQGVLLERLGITARAQSLAEQMAGAVLENHIAAHRRLTHPDEMGTLFKTIALYPQAAPAPPGFDQ
jgi:SAM-dependent MidA family methyltransferase